MTLTVRDIPVSIHLDYVRRDYDCRFEVVGQTGYLQWSFRPAWLRMGSAQSADSFTRRWAKYEVNESYVAEMAHFLRALRREEPAAQDVVEAYRVLEIALAARRSAETRQPVAL